jgi:hypothetical protein
VDDSKENFPPNLDFQLKMVPSISPPVLEQKPAPVEHIPASMSACAAPITQGYHQQAPNPYALMPAPATFQTQYFSAPPAPHPGYQPPVPQAQPAVYYQPQAHPTMQYMAPQPIYHNPYSHQPAPQPNFSFAQPPPSSAFPPQQAMYYQVPQAPGPVQYNHPYPHQPAAVPHYHYPPQHPPTGGV